MTDEQIKEMADKALESLYKAIMSDKITTVQGMCQVIDAVYHYHKMHHKMNIDTDNQIDYLQ